MRHNIMISFLAISFLFFGCNSNEEENSSLASNSNSLVQGQQNTDIESASEQASKNDDNSSATDNNHKSSESNINAPTTNQEDSSQPTSNPDNNEDSTNSHDNSNSDNSQSDDISNIQSDNSDFQYDKEQSTNNDCDSIDNVSLLFMSDLGGYYANDYTASKEPWTKNINSIDEANEFIQTYKQDDTIKDKLISINYQEYAVSAVYIGFRDVCSYKFNITTACKDSDIVLEVISAPAMNDAISHSVVFIQVPIEFKDTNIIIEDKEVSFDEYESYPFLLEL